MSGKRNGSCGRQNRLCQLVDHAQHEGPQTITLRGKPTAVVISVEDFEKLTRPRKPLVEFFRQSPLYTIELDLQRWNLALLIYQLPDNLTPQYLPSMSGCICNPKKGVVNT